MLPKHLALSYNARTLSGVNQTKSNTLICDGKLLKTAVRCLEHCPHLLNIVTVRHPTERLMNRNRMFSSPACFLSIGPVLRCS